MNATGRQAVSTTYRGGRLQDTRGTYGVVARGANLLSKAHQQPVRALASPLVLEDILGLGTNGVVGRLKLLEQLGQLGVDLSRQDRHGNQERGAGGTVIRIRV